MTLGAPVPLLGEESRGHIVVLDLVGLGEDLIFS